MTFFKYIFILSLFCTSLFSYDIQYPKFVEEQMSIVSQMNEKNATKETIHKLIQKQNTLYTNALNEIMVNKNRYINDIELYESEIFTLNKVIQINKRAGNSYAVIRDEVALKSYFLLRSQNKLLKDILLELNKVNKTDFEIKLNELTSKNQEYVATLYEKNYDDILKIKSDSQVLEDAQENIKEFLLLREVNGDFISYLYKLQSKIYRLNKYTKYHLISLAIYVDSFKFVNVVNPILEEYGLSILKLIFIFLLSGIIYFIRKIVYVSLEKYLFTLDIFKDYSVDISKEIRGSIEAIIIIININMATYVYNDFSSLSTMSKFFNMLYGFYVTMIIYKTINIIATIKINKFTTDDTAIKNDLINVGIKIVNFIIIIIGLLIVLFFAGVNLTAVLSGLGIGGFAVAFAAKDTISNFFGTLSILFSDVFSQGDWIEIDGHQGVVVEIGLRVTTIRTFDNALIAIPNGTFASKDVKNWDKRILGRRIKMYVGVKYDSKSVDIKNAIAQIREMLDKHEGIATKATKYEHQSRHRTAKLVSKDDLEGVKNNLLVYLDNFGDSSINILIYCFTKSVQWADWLETKEDVMHKIMQILEENNLEFAFPSLSIYNEKMNYNKDNIC